MKLFPELNLEQEDEINVDSLWMIMQRYKKGKHSNMYHGNFIPQIPNQMIRRFTSEDDIVLDPFIGSGTTLIECERLNRKCIGFDINDYVLQHIANTMRDSDRKGFFIAQCDSTNEDEFNKNIEEAFVLFNSKKVKLAILHPPYFDIIKFTERECDLSNTTSLEKYLQALERVVTNTYRHICEDGYLVLVIGDYYRNKEVIPLGFYCMNMIKSNFETKLKGIIVKNIEGNRGKLGQEGIWQSRALKSDYYLFKHEYIFVFKKVK